VAGNNNFVSPIPEQRENELLMLPMPTVQCGRGREQAPLERQVVSATLNQVHLTSFHLLLIYSYFWASF
jgi:hypothetical protein